MSQPLKELEQPTRILASRSGRRRSGNGSESSAIDVQEHRDLQVLEAISEDEGITQRSLATRLGVALGLTNLYLKRLVRKGYIKCVNVQSNRIRYLITPQGISEKARLTYQFMEYSLQLYRQVRRHLRSVIQTSAPSDRQRIAIFGTGEIAEVAYLTLREFGLEPVAVFDDEGGGQFLGIPIAAAADHRLVDYDHLIVATLDGGPTASLLINTHGVPANRLIMLHPIV